MRPRSWHLSSALCLRCASQVCVANLHDFIKAEVQRLEGKLDSAGGASTSRSASPRGSGRFSLKSPRA